MVFYVYNKKEKNLPLSRPQVGTVFLKLSHMKKKKEAILTQR